MLKTIAPAAGAALVTCRRRPVAGRRRSARKYPRSRRPSVTWLGDRALGECAHDAPRRRIVDVEIGRDARVQSRDEPRVFENVHPAVSTRGGANDLGAPQRVLEFLTIFVERLPLILRTAALDVNP